MEKNESISPLRRFYKEKCNDRLRIGKMVEQKKACPITDTLSAPSGRFGGHPRVGQGNGSSRRENAHNAAVSARGAVAAAGVFLLRQPIPGNHWVRTRRPG